MTYAVAHSLLFYLELSQQYVSPVIYYSHAMIPVHLIMIRALELLITVPIIVF
jgi:hypothetical protein